MKHFLDLAHWSTSDVHALIDLALELKHQWKNGGNPPLLKGKVLGMIFQKPSLRTRVSFEVGMQHLGGHAIYLSPNEIGLGKRESIADVARVLSGYVQGIMARVFEHDHVVELAQWANVPVINGLSDDHHPCQALADVLTIREHFSRTQGLKWAYIGDGNNVAASSLIAAAHFGMHFVTATPNEFRIPTRIAESAQALLQANGATFEQVERPEDAAKDADVLYTDTWISMGQEGETAQRERIFADYQINQALLQQAKPGAIVLHCLPAHRGQEITDEVADGPQSAIFPQAENRLHAQKALLVKLMAEVV
ncbi:MAG: ornithine carbamoyltransferase [Anaerolineae bacterium]|jgi:ornithine carbamoyltransferase|nr:ornithine carbamoyltransferase [Anaerolineae bacterium]